MYGQYREQNNLNHHACFCKVGGSWNTWGKLMQACRKPANSIQEGLSRDVNWEPQNHKASHYFHGQNVSQLICTGGGNDSKGLQSLFHCHFQHAAHVSKICFVKPQKYLLCLWGKYFSEDICFIKMILWCQRNNLLPLEGSSATWLNGFG